MDPACGSGIFLVAAYRRIIQWWRIQNNWKNPSLQVLKNLLTKNIAGVDKQSEAVQLSKFSLSLALCDMLEPKVIWNKLKFNELDEIKLIESDFFKLVSDKKIENDFDLIIGNPPFVEKLGEYGERIEKEKINKRPQIPQKQRAFLFLDEAMSLCKENGLVCLLLPSGPLLYNNTSFDFRKYFFQEYYVYQIFDFTHLKKILFSRDIEIAVSALFVKKEKNNKPLIHITVRKTKTSYEKICFELDKYDVHTVSKEIAMSYPFVWKTNLLGGGRLFYLIQRLNKERTFEDFLEEKKKYGWYYGEGFIIGKKGKESSFLTGKNTLQTHFFTEKGIKKIEILQEKWFHRSKKEEFYKAPHVLIKENIGSRSIPVEFCDYDISFRNEIIGIHAPENQKEDLISIVNRIKNNQIFRFYIICNSGRVLINRATAILKKDIMQLPSTDDEKNLELSVTEKIIQDDVLNYLFEYNKGLNKSKIEKPVQNKELTKFGKVYCMILNSVYKDGEKEFRFLNPIKSKSFICFPFYYGKQKPNLAYNEKDKFDENSLSKLLYKKIGTNLYINRILRIYDDNVIYIIKPKQLRYWLRSIAIPRC